jgi:hypothetical protein
MERSKFIMPELEKECPLCNESFTAKRRNQIFCCKEHQYTHYNYFKGVNKQNIRGARIKQIDQNENTLRRLLKDHGIDCSFTEEELVNEQYHISVFTQHARRPDGALLYMIFEHGLVVTTTAEYKIIKL